MSPFTNSLLSALVIASAAMQSVQATPAPVSAAVTYYTFAATKVASLAGYYITKIDDPSFPPYAEIVIKNKAEAGHYTIDSTGALVLQTPNQLTLTLNPGADTGTLLLAPRAQIPSKYPMLKCSVNSTKILNCYNRYNLPSLFYVCHSQLMGFAYQPGGSNPCPDFCGDGSTTCPTFVGTLI